MAPQNRKTFGVGVVLAISFFAVLGVIFAPVFGDGKNGLTFADDLFNKLSKGSSYFIPKLQNNVQSYVGRPFEAAVTLDKPETAALAAALFSKAGAAASADGTKLAVSGDLGAVFAGALRDADEMYRNDGAAVSARYGGAEERTVLKAWWTSFTAIEKSLKKRKMIEEAKMFSDVNKKAIEAAYNYYGVEAQQVADKALLMASLLVFYVIYTLWWGFAIFYVFDGFGLTMTKAKVKREA